VWFSRTLIRPPLVRGLLASVSRKVVANDKPRSIQICTL
jgi:hypothetical protein